MKLYIIDLFNNREIEVEVEPNITFKMLMDTVINALELPPNEDYHLAFGHKELGPQHYDKTLMEIGLRDGDRLQLVIRPRGGVLPFKRLLRVLENEEEELNEQGYKFSKVDFFDDKNEFTYLEVPTVYGLETVPVVRKYRILNLKALGYWFDHAQRLVQYWDHKVDIYILRSYPLPDDRLRFRAPVRIVWLTPIFHPNIAPGSEYGGTGVVCWGMLKKWTQRNTLLSLLEGLKLLVENPDPTDPIYNPSICLEAAKYFSKFKPPKVTVRKLEE